jgi:hypothetical protein
MLKVSYHAVKGVRAPMLPWIHSILCVHHRSSHEYLHVVTVREEGKGETMVTTLIDSIGSHVFKRLHVLVS